MINNDMTPYQIERLESFKRQMIKRFGIRWASVCDLGKIKLMKDLYYSGYDARGDKR